MSAATPESRWPGPLSNRDTPPPPAAAEFLNNSTPPYPSDHLSVGDGISSAEGHGTLEILKVTQILEAEGLPCCVTGMSALLYYGADVTRKDWEICVPTDQLDRAAQLLKSEDNAARYVPALQSQERLPRSLAHTFPRFKCNGVNLQFVLVPSEDCHFECTPSNFQRSLNGLPYPKLNIYIQSLIDTRDVNALCDAVDGTDVSEEWGIENLDLNGTNDIEWAKRKIELLQADAGEEFLVGGLSTAVVSRRETWREVVQQKSQRVSGKYPEELFATRFRLLGSEDPWLVHRECS